MCTHQKRHLVRRETGKGLLKEVPGDGAGQAAGQSPGEDEPILYLSMHHRDPAKALVRTGPSNSGFLSRGLVL